MDKQAQIVVLYKNLNTGEKYYALPEEIFLQISFPVWLGVTGEVIKTGIAQEIWNDNKTEMFRIIPLEKAIEAEVRYPLDTPKYTYQIHPDLKTFISNN